MISLLSLALPAIAATWTVTETTVPGNPGAGVSLDEAIDDAVDGDRIEFAVSAITVTSALPPITQDDLVIDGAGSVVIDGTGVAGDGFEVQLADGVEILGLGIRNFDGAGIRVAGSTNTTVGATGAGENAIVGNGEAGVWVGPYSGTRSATTLIHGNRIGLRLNDQAHGNCAAPAGDCAGVHIADDAGVVTVTNNVISANASHGVRVHANGAVVQGNMIGTTANGNVARPNTGSGVLVAGGGSPLTSVLGVSIAQNLIGANGGHGVELGLGSASSSVTQNGIGRAFSGSALGNGGDGIHVAAGSSGHVIGGVPPGGHPGVAQLVVANGGSGVHLEGSGHVVQENVVGTASLGNAQYGIRVLGSSSASAHAVSENTVGGNDLGGIWVDAPDVALSDNLIGLEVNGVTAAGNGANPLGSTATHFGGVLFTAPVDPGAVGPSMDGDVVAWNHGHGVWLRSGDHSTPQHSVVLDDLTIGRDTLGSAAGNDGDGVHVEGVSDVDLTFSTVADNSGSGVFVRSLVAFPADRFTISDNVIGDPLGVAGNGEYGIRLHRVAAGMAVTNGLVADNTVAGNEAIGIYSSGGANYNEITHNLISDNGLCALRSDPNSNNAGRVWPAPLIDGSTGALVTGRTELSSQLHSRIARIEVYEGADLEAGTWLGDVTTINPNGTWELAVAASTDLDELRALMVGTDGVTSDLTATPGDGCLAPNCDHLNTDGDWCHFYYWDTTTEQCEPVTRPTGYACSDNDASTGATYHEDVVTTIVEDQCDETLGVCVPGTLLTDADECTYANDCNSASFDPVSGMCTYAATCTECSVDDVNESSLCSDPGVACANCGNDTDGDGIPDDWELGTADFVDCDGGADIELANAGATVGAKDAYLFIAYMSTDCSDTSDAYQQTVHSHKPLAADRQRMMDAFDFASMVLHLETKCIPHFQQVSMAHHRENKDPDCNAVEDYAYLHRLKARYMEPWRRGIYRFGLFAHGPVQSDPTSDQLNDDKCTSTNIKDGDSEANGDDFRVFASKAVAGLPVGSKSKTETNTGFHEYGHTLGLFHGGAGDTNRKPNFQSSMNYRYTVVQQQAFVGATRNDTVAILDYSHDKEDDLQETALDEAAGFVSKRPDGQVRLMTWKCPEGATTPEQPYLPAPQGGVAGFADWNCNGVNDGATAFDLDLNGDGQTNALTGHDDWQKVRLPEAQTVCAPGGKFDDGADVDAVDALYSDMRPVEVDIAPSCPSDSVSLDPTYLAQAVLRGTAALDVSTLQRGTLSLAGARPRRVQVDDVDSDGYDDLRMWFSPSHMHLLSSASSSALFNATSDDDVLLWANPGVDADASYGDADADGVIDPCDACVGTLEGTPVGDDGCP